MLDCLSFLEVLLYYENGMKFEETKAKVLISTYARALNHEAETETETPPANGQGPDKEAFRAVLQEMRG